MIGFSSLIVAWIAWTGKTLGMKLGLLAIALATITGVILAAKVAMAALLSGISYVPIDTSVLQTFSSFAPSNLTACLEALIEARVILFLYHTQWIYVKLYINSASWKVV